MDAGHVDTLFGFDNAVVFDSADNIGIGHMFNAQADQTIVQHNAPARLHIVRQLFICDRTDLVGAFHSAGSQCEFLSGHQCFRTVFENAGANFGSLGVQHGSHRQTQLGAQFFQRLQPATMLLMVTV